MTERRYKPAGQLEVGDQLRWGTVLKVKVLPGRQVRVTTDTGTTTHPRTEQVQVVGP